MSDESLVVDILMQMIDSAEIVQERCISLEIML